MNKLTVADKRAIAWNEWQLAKMGNHEGYLEGSLVECFPDGEENGDVFDDLRYGFYDSMLDDMIYVYQNLRSRYSQYGFYWDEYHPLMNLEEAIEFLKCEGLWKTKIYKANWRN